MLHSTLGQCEEISDCSYTGQTFLQKRNINNVSELYTKEEWETESEWSLAVEWGTAVLFETEEYEEEDEDQSEEERCEFDLCSSCAGREDIYDICDVCDYYCRHKESVVWRCERDWRHPGGDLGGSVGAQTGENIDLRENKVSFSFQFISLNNKSEFTVGK